MNKKQIITTIFEQIIGSATVDEGLIHTHFAADYCQKVDGQTLNLQDFIAHMRVQKQHIFQAQTEFVALVEEGDTVFSQHIVRAIKADGSRVAVQVMARFVLNEQQQILLCDELTHLIAGSAEDADLGSRIE